MIATVNATRMELLRLRRRVALAQRGHRLLSEKRDELSRQLIIIAKHIRPLREKVEKELLETCRRFMLARASTEPEDVKAALEVPTKKFSLAIDLARIMNVQVPKLSKQIEGEIICYGFSTTSGEMDVALLALERAFDSGTTSVVNVFTDPTVNHPLNVAPISAASASMLTPEQLPEAGKKIVYPDLS